MSAKKTRPAYSLWVFYEDTDATGVVYHANYLKYFERARSVWLYDKGLTHTWLRERYDLGFVVARADMRFRSPARLDDELGVSVAVAETRRASLIFEQEIIRSTDLLVKAQFTVACVKLACFTPCALPAELKGIID